MAKKPKLRHVVRALFVSNIAIDGYNNYVYDSKNRKLSYASIATSVGVTVLDFVLAMRSPKRFSKLLSVVSLATTTFSLYKRFKRI